MRTYVRATRFGVDSKGGKVRPGTKFWHEGQLGTWMEPVEGAEAAPSPAPAEPEAQDDNLSEAAVETVEAKPARKRK